MPVLGQPREIVVTFDDYDKGVDNRRIELGALAAVQLPDGFLRGAGPPIGSG